jgi:type I restriction-modification system DNA methylase subunit
MIAKKGFAARAKRAINGEVFGLDRSRSAIELATKTGAQVAVADFFDVEPRARLNDVNLPNSFDAIIGNPPYIRQEVIGNRDKRRIEARLAKDREASPEVCWPRWSGRSDIYVYFFAHAICFLKEGGRLVFLTASSWLDAGYGAALREFLLSNFRIVAIIESAAESFFADASINTSITVLERESDARARSNNSMRFVRLNKPLSEIVEMRSDAGAKDIDWSRALANEIERESHSVTADAYRIRIIEQARLIACKGGPPWPPLSGEEAATAKSGSSPRHALAGEDVEVRMRGGHGGPPIQVFLIASR